VAPARKSIAAGGDVLHQVLPEVPQSARNTITGTVRIGVEVEVDSSGKVTSAQFKSAGPSPYFARLAMQAARDWQFTPTASTWVIQFRIKRTSTQASAQRIKR
jgi:TonB family protein